MVENQNYIDYQMVLRNMLSESIGYRTACEQLALQYALKEKEASEKIEMYWAD